MLSTYNGPNIKLDGEISTIGRGFGYNNSHQDLFNNGKPRSSVQLNFSIPLSRSKTKTKKAAQRYKKNRYYAQAQGNLSKIDAYHDQTVKLVKILKGVLYNQGQSKMALKVSHQENKKKY